MERVYIAGYGVASPAGITAGELFSTLEKNETGLSLPGRLSLRQEPKPAGEVDLDVSLPMPRSQGLALRAAREALHGTGIIPGGIVLGGTTGGMDRTEQYLEEKCSDPSRYEHHGLGEVASSLAREIGVTGPVITISNACASGTAALKLAMRLIQEGTCSAVLAGGADSICRLTYYGFNSLQLIDPEGARPFDRYRQGMTVSEGAAMLLLVSEEAALEKKAELLGVGLSCDAYHPTAPHPEGEGARAAMAAALDESGLAPGDVEYVNLHGTGTRDNDLSEGRAIRSLFGNQLPLLSSIKGITGHTLAAAGALEAVVSTMVLERGFIPANYGFRDPDPQIGIRPVKEPLSRDVSVVLSNSFGFGGSNASALFAKPDLFQTRIKQERGHLSVVAGACVTGAGRTEETLAALDEGKPAGGPVPADALAGSLPPRSARRLKRLSLLALSTALDAVTDETPFSVYFGTGWGGLTETDNFLSRLFSSDEQYSSPTDFISSVHNAPAGQASLRFESRGPNITTTGGDLSFEQALFSASLLARPREDTLLLGGADEFHSKLSPLFDPSCDSDGAGMLLCRCEPEPGGITIQDPVLASYSRDTLARLLDGVRPGMIFMRFSGQRKEDRREQTLKLLDSHAPGVPRADYSGFLGNFATVSAVAAVLVHRFMLAGRAPSCLTGEAVDLSGKDVLMLTVGDDISAFSFRRASSH
jgi:3-oxoacyl-[acyl-carrier-protein] synthase-1/3-oxoacyl-[acyl-carrier-protein] synthase II